MTLLGSATFGEDLTGSTMVVAYVRVLSPSPSNESNVSTTSTCCSTNITK